MNKKLLLGIGIPVVVLGIGVAALIANSVIATNKVSTIEANLKAVSSVADAVYEMNHPGVPWNNSAVIYVAAPVESGSQVARVVEDVYRVAYDAKLADSYTLSVVYVNAAQVRDWEYGDRSTYVNFNYKHDNDVRAIIKEAQGIVGVDVSENRFETTKKDLDDKFSR